MGFILGILGKIIGALMLVGVVAWLFSLLRAALGICRGESFMFFLPFGFIGSRSKKKF